MSRSDDRTDKYTYRLTWSEVDGEHVGLCAELPSLSWLAKTDTEALQGIKEVVRDVVDDMRRSGEAIPEPFSTKKFSGTLTVRIPPNLHRHLTIEASESGVSINRLVSMKLAL
jgi:predicted HicB family RNase H-like nuclease